MFNRKHLLLIFAFCILIEQIYADTRLAYSKKEGVEIFTHSPQWCDTEVQLRYKVDNVGKLNNENLQSLTNKLSKLVENKCPQTKTLEILAGISLDSPSYTAVAQKNSGWKLIQSENTATEQIAGYSSYVPEVKHIKSGNHPKYGGVWYGEIICERDRNHGLRLILNKSEGKLIEGELEIYHVYNNYAALTVTGKLEENGRVTLKPVNWIEKYTHTPPVTISAEFSSDHEVLKGEVTGWKKCERVIFEHFDLPEQYTNSDGVLFKIVDGSIEEKDCLNTVKWLNQNQKIRFYNENIDSNLIDKEIMRKTLGYSFFEWGEEARQRYDTLINQCKTLRKDTLDSSYAQEFDQVRYWWMDYTLKRDWDTHYKHILYFRGWQIQALNKAKQTLINQRQQAQNLTPSEESLRQIIGFKSLLSQEKDPRTGWDNPMLILPEPYLEQHQKFLGSQSTRIIDVVVRETVEQMAGYEVNEKDIAELEKYYANKSSALKEILPNQHYQKLSTAYKNELSTRYNKLFEEKLATQILELKSLAKSNISKLNVLDTIDKEVVAIKKTVDINQSDNDSHLNDYKIQFETTRQAMIDNSAQLFSAEIDKTTDPIGKLNILKNIAKTYFNTSVRLLTSLSSKTYPKTKRIFSEKIQDIVDGIKETANQFPQTQEGMQHFKQYFVDNESLLKTSLGDDLFAGIETHYQKQRSSREKNLLEQRVNNIVDTIDALPNEPYTQLVELNKLIGQLPDQKILIDYDQEELVKELISVDQSKRRKIFESSKKQLEEELQAYSDIHLRIQKVAEIERMYTNSASDKLIDDDQEIKDFFEQEGQRIVALVNEKFAGFSSTQQGLSELDSYYSSINNNNKIKNLLGNKDLQGIRDNYEKHRLANVQKVTENHCKPFVESLELDQKELSLSIVVEGGHEMLGNFLCLLDEQGHQFHSFESHPHENLDYVLQLSTAFDPAALLKISFQQNGESDSLVATEIGYAQDMAYLGLDEWQQITKTLMYSHNDGNNESGTKLLTELAKKRRVPASWNEVFLKVLGQ